MRQLAFADASLYTSEGAVLRAPFRFDVSYETKDDWFDYDLDFGWYYNKWLTKAKYGFHWKKENKDSHFDGNISGLPSFFYTLKSSNCAGLFSSRFYNTLPERYADAKLFSSNLTSMFSNKANKAYLLLKNGANYPYITRIFKEVLARAAIFNARLATEYDLNIYDMLNGSDIISAANGEGRITVSFEDVYRKIISDTVQKYLSTTLCVPRDISNILLSGTVKTYSDNNWIFGDRSTKILNKSISNKAAYGNIYNAETMCKYLDFVLERPNRKAPTDARLWNESSILEEEYWDENIDIYHTNYMTNISRYVTDVSNNYHYINKHINSLRSYDAITPDFLKPISDYYTRAGNA